MRIILACGGTGGHIYPALATLEVLKERHKVESLFILPRKREGTIPCENIEIIQLAPLSFKNSISWLFDFYSSFRKVSKKIEEFSPDVALGMGSYASLPTLLNLVLYRRIPIILHEQNATLGRANKILSYFANKVCLSFPKNNNLKGKFILTGCPVRKEIFSVKKEEAKKFFNLDENKKTILVFGGSQGASQINALLLKLIKFTSEYQYIWITGKASYKYLKEEIKCCKSYIYMIDYLEKMELAYGAADLIICRAGGSTLAELSVLGKPTILIPYPYAKDKHQDINAQIYSKYQDNTFIYKEEISINGLIYKIEELLRIGERKGILSEINLKAANLLAEIIEECSSHK